MEKSLEQTILGAPMSEISDVNPNDKLCAPSKQFKDGSCIDLNILVKMVQILNRNLAKENQIELNSDIQAKHPDLYKKYLVKKLKIKLQKKCSKEGQQCWIEQPFIKDLDKKLQEELKEHTFRPKGPNGSFKWLDTFNINDVMKQYEDKYSDFKYLGTVPIDFDDIKVSDISKLNYNDFIKANIFRIGFVFNLDESWQSGSHWVALFADLKKGQVYYSDSTGHKPPKQIVVLMDRIADFIKTKYNIEPDIRSSTFPHQKGDNACGVYSMSFILRLLKGDSFDQFNSKRISDQEINKCRQVYFTKEG